MAKKYPKDIRRDGLLFIDSDKAVEQNLDLIKKMIRPGNIEKFYKTQWTESSTIDE